MAYKLNYWADSFRQYSLKEYRLKSIEEIPSLILPNQRPTGTILITLDETDNQSRIEKTVWIEEGYIDPCMM